MIENHLNMNNSKTEFLVFGTRNNLDKHTIPSLKFVDSNIINQKNMKFLGVKLDPHITFNDHIIKESEIALYKLSLMCKIEKHSYSRPAQNASMLYCTHSLRLL